jgi:hypothetical protein
LVLAAGLSLVVALSAGALKTGFDQIGQRATPQVAASTDLYFTFAYMDAQVVNVLLVGDDQTLYPLRAKALQHYGQARSKADADLQQAAALGAGDTKVSGLVRTILDEYGRYQQLAGAVQYLNQVGRDPVGQPSDAELVIYRQASAVMASTLRDTRSLISANQDSLDASYQSDRSDAVVGIVSVTVVALALIAVLLVLQVWLRRKVKRRVSPTIALATLAALVIGVAVPIVLEVAVGQFQTAKQDGFDAIINLSQARALAQGAAADESRFLVDPTSAAAYQQDFQTLSQNVIALPGADINHYDAALRSALDAYNVTYSDIRFGGLLAVETGVNPSLTERYAAVRVMARYAGFEVADRQMRATRAAGQLRDAVDFDTNTSLGYSMYNLGRYDDALATLLTMKQTQLNQAVGDGSDAVLPWTLVLPILLGVLIGGLTVVGVWPRLAEYRG